LRLQPVVLLAGALLVACGAETKTAARFDEVVARVNGEEITVRQLNERLAYIGWGAEGGPGATRKLALDAMIDEKLLVQKAIARGLDQDLTTRKAVEAARTRLLARAAIEDTTGNEVISEKEARVFFQANPDLFEKRRVYTFRRFVLEGGRVGEGVKARLDSARTGEGVVAVLKAASIPHSLVTEVRTAESLTSAVLVQAASMAPGDILLLPEKSRTVLMQLAGSVSEPITFESALPSIQEYLADARTQQLAERLVKDLRRKARIEYVTQTADAAKPTALADGKPVLGEPPLKKPLQSQQITVER
jgi:EpsD family peptidyl-prolyl cis-trans isomerase